MKNKILPRIRHENGFHLDHVRVIACVTCRKQVGDGGAWCEGPIEIPIREDGDKPHFVFHPGKDRLILHCLDCATKNGLFDKIKPRAIGA